MVWSFRHPPHGSMSDKSLILVVRVRVSGGCLEGSRRYGGVDVRPRDVGEFGRIHSGTRCDEHTFDRVEVSLGARFGAEEVGPILVEVRWIRQLWAAAMLDRVIHGWKRERVV